MSKSELLVAEQVERADFSSADICSAKPPAVPEAVKRHRKPPEGRVLQGFHEPPPKSVTVSKFPWSKPLFFRLSGVQSVHYFLLGVIC